MSRRQSPSNDDSSTTTLLPESVKSSALVTYRSIGLGLYGAVMRFAGMPLEKIALCMNSSQVSGKNQLQQAIQLTFQDGSRRSYIAPYKVVGGASLVAWFLQYSVMGMIFQICDRAISSALDIPVMPYGSQLMEDPADDDDDVDNDSDNTDHKTTTTTTIKQCVQIVLAPAIAGSVESVVSNRAEVQRFYGISKFAQIEKSLNWNPASRLCGPAYLANVNRNFIMSATSFVITPVLYRNYYPQQEKSKTSLFWFGLGVNIFCGNVIAITQQSLWGRALDYAVRVPETTKGVVEGRGGGEIVARNIQYKGVIGHALKTEGMSAFFTLPKWASRVLMNAPVQGTLPWFYNEVLPFGEPSVLSFAKRFYGSRSKENKKLVRRLSQHADGARLYSWDDKSNNTNATATATSPLTRKHD